jgi:hypothetical protein
LPAAWLTDEGDVAVLKGERLAVRLELEVLGHAVGAAEGVDADELELHILLEEASQHAGHLRRRRRPEHLHGSRHPRRALLLG